VARHSRKRSKKARGARTRPPTGQATPAQAQTKPARPEKARPRTGPARRPSADERPPPLWGPFPLTELVTLAGIILMLWGFLSGGGAGGNAKIGAGLAIASIAGLELAIREHVTGFRSHTTLLSGAVAILAIVVLGLGAGLETLGILVLVGLAAFVGAFVALRELFKRRSGGLSFR
jgi:hypothetical protein